MIGVIAQTFTASADGDSLMSTIGPIVTILSLLLAGWQRVRALNYRDMLHAAAIGLKAALDAMPAQKAEEIKGAIKETVGPLNEAMKAEVRKATAPSLPVYREDGLPKLGGMLLVGLFLSSGCVSGAIHDSALEARRSAAILHRASTPNPAYGEAEKVSYERLWTSHEAALKQLEEAAR